MINKLQSIATRSIHFIASLQDRYVYMSIVVIGFALYFKSLFLDFTYFDDNVLILQNQYFLTDPFNIFAAFQSEVFHMLHAGAAYYRPILTISFMPDAVLGGASPFTYHFTNIVIHLVASCLLYKLLMTLRYPKEFSFLASTIFVVHPVLTQAVSWIPGRNDSLLALFLIPTFLALIGFVESGKSPQLIISMLFFALALFTKESALVFIPLAVMYLWINRSYTSALLFERHDGSRHESRTNQYNFLIPPPAEFILSLSKGSKNKMLFQILAGWGIVIAIWAILRHYALANPIKMTAGDMILSIWNNLPALPQMLGKIFFPFNLSALPIIQDTTFVYGVLAAIVLIAFYVIAHLNQNTVIAKRLPAHDRQTLWQSMKQYIHIFWLPQHTRSNLMMIFGLMWFLAFLLPSFIRPNPTIVADFIEHRVYVPMIGIIIIFGEVISGLSSRRTSGSSGNSFPLDTGVRRYDTGRILLFYFYVFVIILFSTITFFRQDAFVDRLTFWKSAAETSPHSPLANRNLGAMYYLDGDMDSAEVYYKKSLDLNANEEMVNSNLGLIYMANGEYDKAEKSYLRELAINPLYDNVHYNLGLLYYKLSRVKEARQLWQRTLEINPDYEDARHALDATK